MATHSSILAWRIPGTGEPGGLPSLGSHRVGHDWSDLAAAAAAPVGWVLKRVLMHFPDSSVGKESACNAGDPSSIPGSEKNQWRRNRLPTLVFLGFPCGSAGKESAHNVGDLGWISWLGRSPGEGNGYPLQYSGLENSMDYIVYGVAKSRTRLSNFHFNP